MSARSSLIGELPTLQSPRRDYRTGEEAAVSEYIIQSAETRLGGDQPNVNQFKVLFPRRGGAEKKERGGGGNLFKRHRHPKTTQP